MFKLLILLTNTKFDILMLFVAFIIIIIMAFFMSYLSLSILISSDNQYLLGILKINGIKLV